MADHVKKHRKNTKPYIYTPQLSAIAIPKNICLVGNGETRHCCYHAPTFLLCFFLPFNVIYEPLCNFLHHHQDQDLFYYNYYSLSKSVCFTLFLLPISAGVAVQLQIHTDTLNKREKTDTRKISGSVSHIHTVTLSLFPPTTCSLFTLLEEKVTLFMLLYY